MVARVSSCLRVLLTVSFCRALKRFSDLACPTSVSFLIKFVRVLLFSVCSRVSIVFELIVPIAKEPSSTRFGATILEAFGM